MAQHVETKFFHEERFREIEKSIKEDFNKGLKFIKSLDEYKQIDYEEYKINKNDEVFLTNRAIPEGIIYKSKNGSFEIHYDKKKKKLIKIYLVA